MSLSDAPSTCCCAPSNASLNVPDERRLPFDTMDSAATPPPKVYVCTASGHKHTVSFGGIGGEIKNAGRKPSSGSTGKDAAGKILSERSPTSSMDPPTWLHSSKSGSSSLTQSEQQKDSCAKKLRHKREKFGFVCCRMFGRAAKKG
eukprot:GEMP01082681.1.p1 GENE.GEMP01082681.1~~GEMP01082681.1.p1  ORF type:complete len:146 (-),score=42.44 GEMP01082681.1:384-821(-)